jgi:hypothetical protein
MLASFFYAHFQALFFGLIFHLIPPIFACQRTGWQSLRQRISPHKKEGIPRSFSVYCGMTYLYEILQIELENAVLYRVSKATGIGVPAVPHPAWEAVQSCHCGDIVGVLWV